MPRVNLIYERRRRERRQELLARVIALGCEMLAIVLAAVLLLPVGIELKKNAEIRDLSQQLVSTKKLTDQVDTIKKQIGDLQPKLALLQTAQGSTLHWYLILQQVGQGLPTFSWLDTVTFNSTTAPNTPGAAKPQSQESLRIAGETLAAENVADTMRQLGKEPLFADVVLNTLVVNPAAQNSAIELAHFEMDIKLKKAQAPKDAQAPSKN